MSRRIRASTILLVLLAVVLGGNATAFGWSHQEYYRNNTGRPAKDMTKILWGRCTVTWAIHWPFQQHISLSFGPFTLVHWWQGTVPPGGMAGACISGRGRCPRVLGVVWTDENGQIIGPAGPPITIQPVWNGGRVRVDVENAWQRWTGAVYPPEPGATAGGPYGSIQGNVSYTRFRGQPRSLEQLDPNFVAATKWTALPQIDLAHGQTKSFDLGELQRDEYVIFRVEATSTATGTELTSDELTQFGWDDVVPASSRWGLLVLTAALLAGGGLVILWRQRRTAVA